MSLEGPVEGLAVLCMLWGWLFCGKFSGADMPFWVLYSVPHSFAYQRLCKITGLPCRQ